MENSLVLLGSTQQQDPALAAAELFQQLHQPDLALVLLFISPAYDLARLGPSLHRHFGDALVVGCTTAGEIGCHGYQQGSISGVSFAEPDFFAVAARLDNLHAFELSDAFEAVMTSRHELARKSGQAIDRNSFALMLIDGLAACEERVASRLSSALGHIPLLGGSAGDNMRFENTAILLNGRFHSNSAAFVMVASRHPFEMFKSEHAARSGERMVITEADADSRLVTEINAEPAAAEYCRLLGLDPEQLDPHTFAAHPLVLQVGGVPYARSIQRVNDDLSLSFFCSVDEGVVLSGTEQQDLVGSLAHTFAQVRSKLGRLQVVLGCDCILRRIMISNTAAQSRLSGLLVQNRVVGFNTYGEQFNAMHVNQTFTGIAIGYAAGTAAIHGAG
ncbi:nitric oxide-sensing protein NosP [Aquitalea aquatilis]|uniref:nitric oxide-sensing protein NosP n=1 Tax=Aquitalea aquatilis TaxID=1537400 RepID=UPI001FE590F0|nr:nitric oxide-sensing protein NosP [Aquitalea aquatilis]